MKPQTSRVAAFALFGWLAEGCTIRAEVNVDEEAGGATSSIEDPTYDPCVAADSLPDDDKHAAMEAAEARLASEGKSLADAWSDPETFQLLQRAAYREVGCDLSAASAAVPGEQQQPLHDDSGPDYYCGPGHGANRLIVPSVSACLNAACREHDACYAQCSEPTGAFCMWGGPTSTCDEPFMDAMRCRDDAHQFGG